VTLRRVRKDLDGRPWTAAGREALTYTEVAVVLTRHELLSVEVTARLEHAVGCQVGNLSSCPL